MQSGGVLSHNVTKNISLVVLGDVHDPQRLAAAVGFGAEVLQPAELLTRLHVGEDLSDVVRDVEEAVVASGLEVGTAVPAAPASLPNAGW